MAPRVFRPLSFARASRALDIASASWGVYAGVIFVGEVDDGESSSSPEYPSTVGA
jgi:hypothetical protein